MHAYMHIYNTESLSHADTYVCRILRDTYTNNYDWKKDAEALVPSPSYELIPVIT